MWRGDCAPAGLGGLDHLLGHSDSGRAGAGSFCDLGPQTYCGKSTLFNEPHVRLILGDIVGQLGVASAPSARPAASRSMSYWPPPI